MIVASVIMVVHGCIKVGATSMIAVVAVFLFVGFSFAWMSIVSASSIIEVARKFAKRSLERRVVK